MLPADHSLIAATRTMSGNLDNRQVKSAVMIQNRLRIKFPLTVLVIAVLLATHWAMVQNSQAATSQASAAAGKIHTAILEPQMKGKISNDNRHAIVSIVDTLLLEELGHSSQLTMIDRQALDKLLDEYQLQLSQQPDEKSKENSVIAADQLPPVLRQFRAAGVLICTTIQPVTSKKKQYVIDIQAVSAQSGQQVGQVTWVGSLQTESKKQNQPADTSLRQMLVQLAQDIPIQIKRMAGRPLVEVASGQLVSDLNRLQWMVDQLAQSLTLEVEVDGRVALLRPRQADSTRQERFLRVLGLAGPDVNDRAATLRPVPDGRLNFTLQEQFSPEVPFDQTPLALTLNWQSNNTPATQTFTGNISQWQTMRQAASQWATLQRHQLPHTRVQTSEAEDEHVARSMAVQELALMQRWSSLTFSTNDQEVQRRRRVIHHALRAAHLDPTNEEAAYTAALYCDALYNQSQEHESHAGLDLQNQVIAECQRYLSRFAQTADKARVLEVRFKLALAASYASRLAGPPRGLALSSHQNSELYRYASISVPIFLERDTTGIATSRYPKLVIGNLWASTWPLRLELIMNCPDDELDAQYAYWRAFWRTRIEPLKGDTPPWAMMEVFFQTRRGNWQKVRDAYTTLAAQYGLSVKLVWRYGKTLLPPQTLRAAGDPEWSTWMPTFGSHAIEHVTQGRSGSLGVNRPAFIDQLPDSSVLPASKLIPTLHDGTLFRKPLHALADGGGDLWMVTPWIDPSGGEASHELYLTPLPPQMAEAAVPVSVPKYKRNALPLPVKVQPIAWPLHHGEKVTPTITCAEMSTHQSRPVLLLGTRAHGLAIFEQKQPGRWNGRWITTRDGLPANQIFSITPWQHDGRPLWLIRGQSTSSQKQADGRNALKPSFVWTINPTDNTSHILFQGSDSDLYQQALKESTPRPLLASQMTSPQMRQLVKQLPPQTNVKPFLAQHSKFAQARGRMWEKRDATLTARSLQTLEPVAKPIGNSLLWPRLPFAPRMNEDTLDFTFNAGPFRMRNYDETTIDWPAPNVRHMLTWNDMLVMFVFVKSHSPSSGLLAFYQPAPKNSTDWASQDNWTFFSRPERAKIKTFHVDSQGNLWLSSDTGLFRMNQKHLVLAGESDAQPTLTTQAWRESKRRGVVQNLWERTAVTHILDKEYDQALALIEKTKAAEPKKNMQESSRVHFRLDSEFLIARIQVEQGKIDDALATYNHIIAMDTCTPALELIARVSKMVVLHRTKRWQEMLTLYETTSNRFVQLKNHDGSNDLLDMVKQANKALAKSKSDSPSKGAADE